MLQDILFVDFRMTLMRRKENVVKATNERHFAIQQPVLINTETFFFQQVLLDPVMIVQTCLSAPTKVQRRSDVFF